MEAITAAQSDHLVASLDFRLKDDSASYVVDRQEISYFAPSNFYSPSGVKVLRFSLAGTGFLDLSSLVFSALFTNDDSSKALVPLCQWPRWSPVPSFSPPRSPQPPYQPLGWSSII